MERVTKRFLLHNQREKEDIKESDFDELKQEVQMVRFEMTNEIVTFKENLLRYTSILHTGLSLFGDFFVHKTSRLTEESVRKFFSFRSNMYSLENNNKN